MDDNPSKIVSSCKQLLLLLNIKTILKKKKLGHEGEEWGENGPGSQLWVSFTACHHSDWRLTDCYTSRRQTEPIAVVTFDTTRLADRDLSPVLHDHLRHSADVDGVTEGKPAPCCRRTELLHLVKEGGPGLK